MTQPNPTPNSSTPIWHLVIDDMQARDFVGRERYGTPLQAHNGRDALQDAYEEALDMTVYLRQAIEEKKNFRATGFCQVVPGTHLNFLDLRAHLSYMRRFIREHLEVAQENERFISILNKLLQL